MTDTFEPLLSDAELLEMFPMSPGAEEWAFARAIERAAVLRERERVAKLNTQCTHVEYSFAKHGRVCPCGKMMVDFGD